MKDDATKKTDHVDQQDRAPDKIDSLPEQPITDSAAQAVKGGYGSIKRLSDEGPKE